MACGLILPAIAADGRIEFRGGIGSTPFASASGVPAPNDVRGIAPGRRPRVIDKLRAAIRADGSISVKGEGLLLAGGNSIGLPGLTRQMVATLFCGATALNSPAADLDADGNFAMREMLQGALPSPCVTPTLLIRNFTANGPGPWFAGGTAEN